MGGALTIAASGVAFAVATRAGADPFVAALTVGCAAGVLGVVSATRTGRTASFGVVPGRS